MAPTKHRALINVDMGEAYGNYVCGPDKELLPMIDHANVACGFQYVFSFSLWFCTPTSCVEDVCM